MRRGANMRRFAFMKSRDGVSELGDLLSVPAEGEGAVIDELRKHDADETTEEAAVAFVRLAKAFSENVPAAVMKAMAKVNPVFGVASQKPMPGDGGAAGAKRDGSADGAARDGSGTADEDLDGDGKGGDKDGDGDGAAVAKEVLSSEGEGGNTNNEGGSDMPDVVAPVRKEDGSWDLSGVAPETREFYGEVLKSQADAAEREKQLAVRVEKAEADAKGAADKLREREFVAKAADYEHIAKADEVGPVLKAIADAVDEETYGKLEGFLKTADERIATGDLFRESKYVVTDSATGKVVKAAETSTGSADAKLDELAKALVEKGGDMTFEKAYAKVLETAEGRELYAQSLNESGVR